MYRSNAQCVAFVRALLIDDETFGGDVLVFVTLTKELENGYIRLLMELSSLRMPLRLY